MGFTIASPSRARTVWASCAFVFGIALASLGGFTFGRAEMLGLLAMVAGGVLVAVAISVSVHRWHAAATVAIAVGGGLGGISVGRAKLRSDLREEIVGLSSVVVSPRRIPDVFDVPRSRLFRRAFVSPDPTGDGYRVRFPMRDGSVLEYVSNKRWWPGEQTSPCSEEIEAGWYRKFRC